MFFAKPQTPPAKPVAATSSPAAPTAKETAQNPSLTSGKVKAGAKSPKSMASPKDISVETAQYTAIFSTRGGALKSFQLKGYQKDCAQCVDDIYPRIKNLFTGSKEQLPPKSKGLVELVDLKEGMPYPLAITFPESSIDIAPDAFFETNVKKLDLINAKEKQSLVFFHKDDNKIKVEKTFTFNPDNFTITLDVKISNLTNSPLNQIPKLSWQQYADPNMEEDSYGHDGPIASVAKSIELQSLKELNKEKLYGPNILWGGYESKYFIASFIPQNPSLTSLIMDRDAANMVSVSIKGPKEIIPGNQSGSFSYTLYLGPKEHSLLKSQNVGLEDAIDFGWFYWLAMPLLWVLNFLHNYIANYGLYKALLYSIELRHSPLFWWIQDLSAKDPYYITPIIMGATQFIQQKMTPTMGDPMQAKIMLFMPIIFTFFFLNFPSGLVIYWLFNNVLSIGQQYYINKKLAN
jgi:YidC/Oxa1 family membrane protein insertase